MHFVSHRSCSIAVAATLSNEHGQSWCESGCAYHGIIDFVTNTLMKVQHVAVSENSVHNSCVPWYGDLDLEIRTLSANLTESATWIGVTRHLFSTPNVL